MIANTDLIICIVIVIVIYLLYTNKVINIESKTASREVTPPTPPVAPTEPTPPTPPTASMPPVAPVEAPVIPPRIVVPVVGPVIPDTEAITPEMLERHGEERSYSLGAKTDLLLREESTEWEYPTWAERTRENPRVMVDWYEQNIKNNPSCLRFDVY